MFVGTLISRALRESSYRSQVQAGSLISIPPDKPLREARVSAVATRPVDHSFDQYMPTTICYNLVDYAYLCKNTRRLLIDIQNGNNDAFFYAMTVRFRTARCSPACSAFSRSICCLTASRHNLPWPSVNRVIMSMA